MSKKKTKPVIALSAPVSIQAAPGEGKPAAFSATFYTGGAVEIMGWDLPVVVDLSGLGNSNILVANLDHDRTQRVGNFEVTNDGKSLVANGTATAATAARDEVIQSAANGYQWQASMEVAPKSVEEVKTGAKVTVNGQEFTGPLYITRTGTLKGFAFVSHGADDNTTVTVAASSASGEKIMKLKPEVKAWAETMGINCEDLTEDQAAAIEANYSGLNPTKKTKRSLDDSFDSKKAEHARVESITEIALTACDRRPFDIDAIKALAQDAIDGKWSVDKFRLELMESTVPLANTVFASRRNDRLTNKVLEAAICQAGRLGDIEDEFDDQTLQVAHDKFKSGISLNQLFLLCAQANGYSGDYSTKVDVNVQRAAFGMTSPMQRINASGGFSTVSIANVLSNVANKFLMQGWNAVDMTPLQIARIRNVRDFKTVTTVSLTGDLTFDKVGASGEIKHGQLGDMTYTNKADTYAKMLAITRTDIINDDLGALTDVPMKLGRGGALKLNDIFWTEFLANTSFFTSGNSNVNEGVADMTTGGLAATEVVFMNQTDPDGLPLGLQPAILLVPTALKAAAMTLMNSELLISGTSTATQGSTNIWRGRFRVYSSPYMSNSAYTGYSAAAWYMLADPADLPVIEIAALNGRVEPTVETADAEFNVLGVQMRGYSDVGVNLQEYRAGVRADGGSS